MGEKILALYFAVSNRNRVLLQAQCLIYLAVDYRSIFQAPHGARAVQTGQSRWTYSRSGWRLMLAISHAQSATHLTVRRFEHRLNPLHPQCCGSPSVRFWFQWRHSDLSDCGGHILPPTWTNTDWGICPYPICRYRISLGGFDTCNIAACTQNHRLHHHTLYTAYREGIYTLDDKHVADAP
jgi:hypothetical protein